jgi:diguanylate cyclase (GGDEF)-like protein
VLVAAFLGSRPAPEADSVLPHVALAAVYLSTTGAMFAFAPQGSAALPALMFVGVVAPVWIAQARQIAAHYGAAAILLLLPNLLGQADPDTLIAYFTVVPTSFVLGYCVHTVLGLAEQQSDRFEQLAMRDPLTGVGNRRLLDDQLAVELERHRGARRPFTVFALDLHGFKSINDTLGHAAGDRVLQDVASRLQLLAGDRATVCRLGGDEFAIVMPGLDGEAAEAFAHDLRDNLGAAVRTGIGSATYPDDADGPNSLLEIADARLVANKAGDRVLPDAEWLAAFITPSEGAANAGPSAAEVLSTGPRRPISRDVLGAGRVLWRVTGLMFVYFATVSIAFQLLGTSSAPGESLGGPTVLPLTLVGFAIGIVVLRTPPPALHTWGSDLVLALSYIVPFAADLAIRPSASALIGFGVFVGPLVAVRTRTRARAAVHVGAALGLSGAVAVSGLVDAASLVSIALLDLATIVLAFYSVIVLEACEAEGGELERLSQVDPLTHLANRRQLIGGLQEFLAADDPLPVAVIALDLNGFKHLNDTMGHGAGDDLLIEVAERLRATAGPDALTARPGGDEFTIVLRGSRDSTTEVADRIRESIGELRPRGCAISTGLGLAFSGADGATADVLLKIADERLIDDKYGRHRIVA